MAWSSYDGGGNAWRRLWRQIELEPFHQDFLVCIQFRVAAHDECATISRGELHVEHLYGSELVEHGAWREAWSQGFELRSQRDVKAIGNERNEDVRLDALLELMEDRAQLQIILHGLEGGFDFDELNVELPELGRILSGQIGAQR